jgi:type I restriction enzyme, S subunit
VDDASMWSESDEDGLPWVSIGDMSDGQPVTTTARRVTESGLESKRLPIGEPGTLLFAMYASVGAVGRLATRATWNQALLGIAPRFGLSDERFIRYWLEHLRPSLSALTRSNTQDNLNAEQVGNFPFPDMPLAEQRAIADYLDAETARIDALIAKKQQLIHLLEERVRGLAVDLVAGHLDGHETGIPSIPIVPRGWRVLRNKVIMREVNGPSETGDEEMLSVSHLTGVSPRSEKTVYMFEAESTVGYKLVEPGDLVINTMWAWMGAAGVSYEHGIVSPAYGVYRINPAVVYPPWIDLVIRTEPYVVEMTRFSRGVTSSRLRLYPDEFLRLAVLNGEVVLEC